jgi:uncharacterized membrane protein YphA (DoxX/SURF4 family)
VLLRLILGIIYIMHAYLAAVVLGPAGMIAYQAKAGVPFPEIATWYLILAHGLGGICLTLGLFTCWAALANVPVMLGALLFVHLKSGFWADKGGFVRLLGRHPAFELDAAAACDQASIVRLGLGPNAALHVAALLVRQDVTA